MVAEIKEKQNFAATSESVSTPQKDAEFQAGAGSVDLKTELISKKSNYIVNRLVWM